ncbi:MAG: hypothetical protein RL748_790, partial [Pseudomonadota bacterium]
FSRGIENCALREVLLWAKRRGLSEVQGEFIASAKNGKYVAFFPENGFTTLPASTELAVFSHDLQSMAQPSSWIALDSPFLEADCVPL